MSRSRSNITATIRQPSPSRSSSAAARPTARASVAWIMLNAMSDGSVLSCAAAWRSVIRVEIAAPIWIGKPRRRGG